MCLLHRSNKPDLCRLDEFKHQMSRQGWNKAPQELWDTDRIKERIPIMDIETAGVIGGLYNPLGTMLL